MKSSASLPPSKAPTFSIENRWILRFHVSLMNDFPWDKVVIYGIPAVGILGYRLLSPVLRARKDGTAKAWPQTTGYAEHTPATTISIGGRDNQWVGQVAYSYRADGEYYTGLLHFPTTTEKQAEKSIKGWKGLQLIVRYRAERPTESHIILNEQQPRITLS
jgi:hypothetical protein